jgi:hypothetical protein
MENLKYAGLLVGVGLLAYWVLPAGSPARSAATDSPTDVAYLCRETSQLILAPPQQVPAVNPQTGRATLFRALYCPDCQDWRAVPPPETFSGNPLTYPCPKHKRQMTATGPLRD